MFELIPADKTDNFLPFVYQRNFRRGMGHEDHTHARGIGIDM
jgi:sarcosine oxidase delta subunit